MGKALRLSHAGALAGLFSIIALSCGSDIIDLLPPPGGASNDAGGSFAGQAPTTGGTSWGGANTGANTNAQAGLGGTTQANAGSAGAGCYGSACGNDGFSGSFGGLNCGNGNALCLPCASDAQCPLEQHCSALLNNTCVQCATKGQSQCKPGYNCDVLNGHCAPSCTTNLDCNNGRVCDPSQGTCVSCVDNRECEQDGDSRTSVCYLRRCVECAQHSDCSQAERRLCSGFQCVQCLLDKDCDGGKGHCDAPRGRCE